MLPVLWSWLSLLFKNWSRSLEGLWIHLLGWLLTYHSCGNPSELATEGCVAYDYSLQQEVLFMTIPLCLLADSPMAAEFTNTPIPGSSNNPCRICHLHCPQGDVRSTMTYMQEFFGHPQLPTDRKWCETQGEDGSGWFKKIPTRPAPFFSGSERVGSLFGELPTRPAPSSNHWFMGRGGSNCGSAHGSYKWNKNWVFYGCEGWNLWNWIDCKCVIYDVKKRMRRKETKMINAHPRHHQGCWLCQDHEANPEYKQGLQEYRD